MMRFVALLAAGALTVLAQGPPEQPQPQRGVAALKAALSLTDQQVNLLMQNQRERSAALRPIYEQLAERQRTFSRAQEDETNPAVIGNIVLDMVNLRKQIPIVSKRFDDQALAILTPDQRPKLQALDDARKLQPAINQAVSFGLLEGSVARAVGFIGPIEPITGPGPRMMHRGRRGGPPTQ
jgi:hypothetical protein